MSEYECKYSCTFIISDAFVFVCMCVCGKETFKGMIRLEIILCVCVCVGVYAALAKARAATLL